MLTTLVVAGLILAHGLIHLGFVAHRPAPTAGGPEWPFELSRSWLLTRFGVPFAVADRVGRGLVAGSVVGFGLAAVVVLGLVPGAAWPATIALGSVASLGLLAIFFHPWLVLGIVIDVAALLAVVIAGWRPVVG
jgi:hypothetical protein